MTARSKIIQTSSQIVFLYEDLNGAFWRIIPIDGRGPREDAEEGPFGDSVGRWDGDTLVIETDLLGEDTWLTDNGAFHTFNLKTVEEMKFTPAGGLDYKLTSHDPDVLLEPFVKQRTLVRNTKDPLQPPPCVQRSIDKMVGIESYHPEHDLGAQAFPATTTLIRTRAQVREIAEDGMRTADLFRGRSDINKRLLEGAQFRPADLTFDGEHRLDLGGVSARILALGPGHTQGDTVIHVEEDGVLFSGDLAMRALPAFASSKSSLNTWIAALDRLEALRPGIIVPSYGPVGDAGYVTNYRIYLTRVRERVAALKREGKTVDKVIENVIAELKADYPDMSHAAGAIRAAYAETP